MKPFDSEPLVKFWIGQSLWIFCNNPEDMKIILNSPNCTHKDDLLYETLFKLSLLTMNDVNEYKAHRKAIAPLFTPKSLSGFITLINQTADEFLISFDKELRADTFDIAHSLMNFSITSVFKTFLMKDGITEDFKQSFVEATDK
jgi:cytochrome P450